MARYIVSRLAMAAIMALLATLVIFLIANTVPGDPVLSQLGDLAASNKEFVAEWRAKWGLDLPLWERYVIFLQRLAPRRPRHLDRLAAPGVAGYRAISRRRRSSSPASPSCCRSSIGVPLGIMAAVRRDSWIDHLARLVSLIGVSSPTFWLAFIMLAVFYGGLQIAPGPGRHRRHRPAAAVRHRPLSDRQRSRRRLGDLPRCARPSDPALDRAWRLPRSASSRARRAPACWRACSRITCASRAPRA